MKPRRHLTGEQLRDATAKRETTDELRAYLATRRMPRLPRPGDAKREKVAA